MYFCGHPIVSSLLSASAIFGVLYFAFYWPKKGFTWDFDPGGRSGEFEKHAARYQSIAKLVLTLAAASVAFLLNFLVNIDPLKPRNGYSVKLESASPAIITFLCLSVACGLSFLLCQALFYEDYVHAKYPANQSKSRETYTAARYAWNLTLAASGLLYFLIAYILAAACVLR